MFLRHYTCSQCGRRFPASEGPSFCPHCQAPLLAEYDLPAVAARLKPETIRQRPRGLWRWAELLPVAEPAARVNLGAGDTPLVPLPRLARHLGLPQVWVKDESRNPTGTFKARGMAVAVSLAVQHGRRDLVLATAGNAGGALAAYAARAGLRAHIFMPRTTPAAIQAEIRAHTPHVTLVDGDLAAAGRFAAQAARRHGWFEVSTFKEPGRVEGKKTMGLELAEAFDYTLPDLVFYPTGGGTGLVGMWKAWNELRAMGWLPRHAQARLIAVQSTGCAPVVRAWETGAQRVSPWGPPRTIAAGLAVPRLFADRLVLRALRETDGGALAVPDAAIVEARRLLARFEGIYPAPEGAAPLAGLLAWREREPLPADARVILFNTGTGLKYPWPGTPATEGP